MRPRPFEIERYFARYEFASRHLLSCSDCEPLTMAEVLALADEETRAMWAGLSLAYTDSAGAPALRHEIASLYTGLGDDQVLEVVPEEGILLAMQTVLDPGDHVVVTWPAYQSLYSIAEAIGCAVTPWRAREEEGWRFDPSDLEEALRPDTRLVVVNFPHNPTGYLPSAGDLDRIVRMVRESGARLFCDEMYRTLEQDPADRLASATELDPTALVLSGMSKTLSMPGIRVGWLASRDDDLIARLAAAKDYTTICGSAPGEVLAIIGLRARTRILERNLRICRENLDAIDAIAGSVDGFAGWTRPKAGSVGLARWEVAGGTRAACERLAEEAGIMLLPSSVFGAGDRHVRLGFGRSAFADGLEAFVRWTSGSREDGA